MNTPGLLEQVLVIAQEAGEKILTVYQSDFAVTHKDDETPLTQADMAAHHHIVAALERLQPRLPVLSEEAAQVPYSVRRHWQHYWLVDPLDGTREFVKRNGDFTVNIALIENHQPVLGVVHAPVTATSYAAAREVGAFRRDRAGHASLRCRKMPEVPTFVVSRSHQDVALSALLARAPRHEAVSRGSSLKFCLVAEGSADFYPRTGPTSEWDTAAGQCVVEQAGGAVWRLPELTPLACNEEESLRNPSFAVVGDLQYDWATLLKTS